VEVGRERILTSTSAATPCSWTSGRRTTLSRALGRARGAALFVLILLGASLVIAPSLFERTLGHDVGIDDYVRLA
jgi:hypothetical protein